jgi:multidrug efflux pump subunit AcrB
LTGTLITVAGFIPIGLNTSAAGEFTFSLFVVIAVSLTVSWIVAVLFAPLIGVTLLPKKMKHHDTGPGRIRAMFHAILRRAMHFRWATIALTLAVFAVSIYGLKFVEQQFFPNSDRPELVVDMVLAQNTSITETQAQMDRLEAYLHDDENVKFWTSYVGRGAPRFLLAFDVPTPGPNMGQIVIQTPSIEARNALREKLDEIAVTEFPGADIFVKLLEIGPPVGRPVQYRISGPDPDALRDQARDLAALMASDDRLTGIVLDWNEPARVVRIDILQDKARQLGLSSSDISAALDTIYDGKSITALRDDDYLVDIRARGAKADRQSVEALSNLQLSSPSGRAIPLRSVATFSYETEQPLIHQRDRMPTITVKAAVATADQPATIVAELSDKMATFNAGLPFGYAAVIGGTVEASGESQAPIVAVFPIMILIMLTLTMIQMQSFRLTFVVFCVAPLGMIGVSAALLLSAAPLGFVAILGVLALVGILIRNSIILVTEIEVLRRKGRDAWDAVFEASDSRARPILLTAAAASLALIPISRQIFWGPMAFAMMGGIIAGTVITLVFVPALYLVVFKVKRHD